MFLVTSHMNSRKLFYLPRLNTLMHVRPGAGELHPAENKSLVSNVNRFWSVRF